ncbi:MAG: mechanosensitive ion channel family protein [Clostridia bacterium]|nr:mechanosensitive ion channel family protein [Clostridia bacterium]
MFEAIFNKQQILEFANIFYVQIAISIIVVFFIFRAVFAKTIIKIVNVILKRKEKASENPIYKTLKSFIIFIGFYFATLIMPLSENVSNITNGLFKIVAILFITKILTIIINKDSTIFKKIFNSKNESVNSFFCKILRAIIWILSFVIIFKLLGFDLTGLVAGLGVGSVIISLAAQDTVKSLLSGVTILTEKPFEIGDWIKVGINQGTVLDITFKSTRIKASDNTIITIPNSMITEDCVINWNKLKSRRFDCILKLNLDTTAIQIKKIIEKMKLVLKNNPNIDSTTVQVVFDAISAYSSDIKIFLYINESDYLKYLKVKEEIYYDLLNIIDKENIELAYPTQTIHLAKNEGENK